MQTGRMNPDGIPDHAKPSGQPRRPRQAPMMSRSSVDREGPAIPAPAGWPTSLVSDVCYDLGKPWFDIDARPVPAGHCRHLRSRSLHGPRYEGPRRQRLPDGQLSGRGSGGYCSLTGIVQQRQIVHFR